MKRILILGAYGSGKTTFGCALSELLKIPVHHLDRYYWKENWQIPSLEEWTDVNQKIIKQEVWIIEGNYLKTLDYRIKECDTIIYLETNKWLCIYRVLKRTLLNVGRQRKDLPDGCIDRINFAFLKSVFLFDKNIRPIIFKRLKKSNHKLFIHNSTAKKFVLKYLPDGYNNLHS